MNIIQFCTEYLQLQRPIKIELLSRENKKFDAIYTPHYSDKKGKLTHYIRVYMGNANRELDSAIAHELIHAWQEEYDIQEYHGPEFIKRAKFIEKARGIKDVYCEGVDNQEPKIK